MLKIHTFPKQETYSAISIDAAASWYQNKEEPQQKIIITTNYKDDMIMASMWAHVSFLFPFECTRIKG